MQITARLPATLLLLAPLGCTPDGTVPANETKTGETGSDVGMACENPGDDMGFGTLDRNDDGMFDVQDLEPGESAVQAIWTDASGTKTVWRQVTTNAEIWHGNALGDLTQYGVWLTLTDPETMGTLYTTAVFEGPVDGIDAPGLFTRVAANWDIASIERGGTNDAPGGSIELTDVVGDVVTGLVPEPSGPISIIDHLDQAATGDVVCVQKIVFREIAAEFTH